MAGKNPDCSWVPLRGGKICITDHTALERERRKARKEMDFLTEVTAINRVFTDRSAGRWCDVCRQNGSHHTERHAEFAKFALLEDAKS